MLELAKNVDVVIHNNRPQTMTKLGLDYDDIKAVNPGIIYCGSYGYGKDGPYGAKGALDDSIQAASGIAMLQEMVLGEPRYLPTVVADKTTAMAVVFAVTAALYHREKTGVGQEIEVPMFETMVYWVMAEHLWGMTFEPPLGTAGYKRLMSYHRKPYKTKDGYTSRSCRTSTITGGMFCELSGREDLLEDERFTTLSDRVEEHRRHLPGNGQHDGDEDDRRMARDLRRHQRADDRRQYAERIDDRPAPAGRRFLAAGRAPDRGHVAHGELPGELLRVAGDAAQPAAAAGRRQRRDPARGGHPAGRDRRDARVGRDARSERFLAE